MLVCMCIPISSVNVDTLYVDNTQKLFCMRVPISGINVNTLYVDNTHIC